MTPGYAHATCDAMVEAVAKLEQPLPRRSASPLLKVRQKAIRIAKLVRNNGWKDSQIHLKFRESAKSLPNFAVNDEGRKK
jgi:hypothetical protein